MFFVGEETPKKKKSQIKVHIIHIQWPTNKAGPLIHEATAIL